MALPQVLQDLRGDHAFMANVVSWQTLPARSARFAPIPDSLHSALHAALDARGMAQLYGHQAQAVAAALGGQNLAIVTPTASGKTLCYNLPVLHALLSDENARALYLFPTKALAQDQLAELSTFLSEIENTPAQGHPFTLSPAQVATYDGDTSSGRRPIVRKEARIILSNPDMLHAGILPYHTNWADFFGNLRFIVLDEMHTYRGVFGSHVANVLRRLRRICQLYGSTPQFVCTSATIANPGELAERLIEQPVTVVDENGAPSGAKHVILYNPPLLDPERGIRRSSALEVQELATRAIMGGVQTIVFGRSRMTTELLLTYIRDGVRRMRESLARLSRQEDRRTGRQEDAATGEQEELVRGYRGGYLPNERRAIEAGLRAGAVQGVVTTNALELGIDIGQLQAAILCGYPGSIASTWQQMGRAGRTQEEALAILVATADVLDQYILQQPDYIFERTPEHALINPDNLMLLVDQMRCAAFELPFRTGEGFGASPFTADVLALLCEDGDVQENGGRFFWSGEGYPARQVSLRSAGGASVLVQAEELNSYGHAEPRIIGEVDEETATFLLHEGAVYIHEGSSYLVHALDLASSIAHVAPAEVDYYTNASSDTQIEVLDTYAEVDCGGAHVQHGDLLVRSQVVGYRRIKRFTHETLGTVPLEYPPHEWETSGYWFCITAAAQRVLEEAGQWHDSPNDYGPNWQAQRQKVRARDGFKCSECGRAEPKGRQHDVHHVVPFRTFGYVPGLNENYKDANRSSNLVLVCRACHQRLEASVRVRGGMDGLAYIVHNLAPLHLMCDPADLGVSAVRVDEVGTVGQEEDGGGLPTVYVYERIAAGLGFGARLFELHELLLQEAQEVIEGCACLHGCPSCVGPVLDDAIIALETKALTLALVRALRDGGESSDDLLPAASTVPPSARLEDEVEF